jgi:hypothetical protein
MEEEPESSDYVCMYKIYEQSATLKSALPSRPGAEGMACELPWWTGSALLSQCPASWRPKRTRDTKAVLELQTRVAMEEPGCKRARERERCGHVLCPKTARMCPTAGSLEGGTPGALAQYVSDPPCSALVVQILPFVPSFPYSEEPF